MEKYKISAEEFDKVSIKRIATNPGARSEYGESSMKGEALKERMDKPYELFREKFNTLVELIVGTATGDSITKHIPTGITRTHTIADMIRDVTSEGAEFAAYLSVGERTLLEALEGIDNALSGAKEHAESQSNPHKVTAEQLGLERVDNTSDAEKPLSLAAMEALGELGQELSDKEAALAERIAQALIDAKGYADDTKVGKTGNQTIGGSLSLGGDLLVGGKTYAKQIESLEVGDAVIIANSDGVLLAELSGYVIRVNGNSAYAIVYDPADDCVKIGLGTYDATAKVFTFGAGEAQVLATRGVIADGNIPVWDNEKNTFKDSALNAEELGGMIIDMDTTAEAVNAALARINELADAYIGDETTGELGGEE